VELTAKGEMSFEDVSSRLLERERQLQLDAERTEVEPMAFNTMSKRSFLPKGKKLQHSFRPAGKIRD